jgi:hydrogenase expression/formation protein HypD
MNPYRDGTILKGLLGDIGRSVPPGRSKPLRIMEVCGTHTMALHRHGLKPLLAGAGVDMISGPGCPVCVTPDAYHEAALDLLTGREDIILAAFGDMTRVPTRRGAIQHAVPARGSRLRIVYAPGESLEIARRNPSREVVFFGAGFETTIPSIGLTVREARGARLPNYSVLAALWLIGPPLRALCEGAGGAGIDGFLYPGHVSAITGLEPYAFIPAEFGIPGAVAGFEPADILLGLKSVLDQIRRGRPEVANAYARVVRPGGNVKALALMKSLFEPRDAVWRGLGRIPGSGLALKKAFGRFDAVRRFGLSLGGNEADLPGCRCGDVLRGAVSPPECPLFASACKPDSPRGPCMVSYEGACLVHFKYAGKGGRPGKTKAGR